MSAAHTTADAARTDWYERRAELEPGQIFITFDGSVVMLDFSVPGDGTKWYVADWWDGWSYQGGVIEPGDLIERFTNVNAALAAAKTGGAK